MSIVHWKHDGSRGGSHWDKLWRMHTCDRSNLETCLPITTCISLKQIRPIKPSTIYIQPLGQLNYSSKYQHYSHYKPIICILWTCIYGRLTRRGKTITGQTLQHDSRKCTNLWDDICSWLIGCWRWIFSCVEEKRCILGIREEEFYWWCSCYFYCWCHILVEYWGEWWQLSA